VGGDCDSVQILWLLNVLAQECVVVESQRKKVENRVKGKIVVALIENITRTGRLLVE
jgi:hypothetical protein